MTTKQKVKDLEATLSPVNAASPELLEALQMIEQYLERSKTGPFDRYDHSDCVDLVRTAIYLARGLKKSYRVMIATPEDGLPEDSWFSEPDQEFDSEQAAINHAAKLLRDGEDAWIDVSKPQGDAMVYDYHIERAEIEAKSIMGEA